MLYFILKRKNTTPCSLENKIDKWAVFTEEGWFFIANRKMLNLTLMKFLESDIRKRPECTRKEGTLH
jgi:hypothetical protein